MTGHLRLSYPGARGLVFGVPLVLFESFDLVLVPRGRRSCFRQHGRCCVKLNPADVHLVAS